jgi:replicative DNA helicase
MSAALQAIRSIIDNSSRSTMRVLTPALFMEEEAATYDFLTAFYQRHGALPSVEIMRQNGFVLPSATGPLNYYIDRLRDRAVYAAAAGSIEELERAVTGRDIENVRRIVSELGRAIMSVEGHRDVIPLHELFSDVLAEALLLRLSGAGGLTGVPFGWHTMDRATAGAQPGDVISVVARPNVGKSWTIIQMALAAWAAGHSVCLVTMEMTDHQMARRMLALASGVNPDAIRRGQIDRWGEEILHEWIERAPGMAPFHIMSGSFRKTTMDIDRVVKEFGPDHLLIDASYLVGSQKKQRANGSRWERIYDVGEEIKGIAQDNNIPVTQSLQLNREKKEGTAFDMNQIAGGDVIGQISSVVVAVDFPDDPNFKRTRRKYIGGKNRDGELFDFQSNFLFNPMDFSELPPEDENALMNRLMAEI